MKTLTQLYDEHESDFLTDMVARFFITPTLTFLFQIRFLKANDDLSHEKLSELYSKELPSGSIVRNRVEAICNKLEEMGCPPSKNKDKSSKNEGRWTNCRYWLREEMFKTWAKEQGLTKPKSIDECWQELKEKGNTTTGLTVEIPVLSNMGARPNRKRHEIPAKSDLIYRVDSPKMGHLILFEREPNGTIVCLCPSEFATSTYHAGKETKLPHPDSEYEFFGSDELGWEQLIAVITPELPPFQWLEDSRKEALEVNQEHLAGLLDYVNGQPNAEVLYTEYLVIAA